MGQLPVWPATARIRTFERHECVRYHHADEYEVIVFIVAALETCFAYFDTVVDIARAVCQYCGNTANQVDHVIPVSQGGTHSRSNLVASCATCNNAKNQAQKNHLPFIPINPQ